MLHTYTHAFLRGNTPEKAFQEPYIGLHEVNKRVSGPKVYRGKECHCFSSSIEVLKLIQTTSTTHLSALVEQNKFERSQDRSFDKFNSTGDELVILRPFKCQSFRVIT